MPKVIVLGGYGGFGARLCRRLAHDGWQVLVAGRRGEAAANFAATIECGLPLQLDRNGDIVPVLIEHHPALLIDATGPFQSSSYNVVEACLTARVHYYDFADSRAFVCGIDQFDERARLAGIAVISGSSSVPALSQAVADSLASGFDRVEQVDAAISASSRTIATRSVSAAAMSYAGQPIPFWRAGRWTTGTGGQCLKRLTYRAGGKTLKRSVALADIPDLALGPDRFPGKPSTIFRAGPDFRLQLFGLWLLSWLVRWGWVNSLAKWNGAILPLQRLFALFGGERSAMSVNVTGRTFEKFESRSWQLIAESGDGPEVPVLAAQLIARKVAADQLQAGARTAAGELELAEFEALFEELDIKTQVHITELVPLYRRALRERYSVLPPPVRDLHDSVADSGAIGEGQVKRGPSIFARILATIMRFPPAGNYELHVGFAVEDGRERWTRDFGGHRFSSELSQDGDGVIERFGSLRFHFNLKPSPDRLRMLLRKWSLFNIPVPLFLAPRIEASESAEGDQFRFDVRVSYPLLGPIVHYDGRLQRIQGMCSTADHG